MASCLPLSAQNVGVGIATPAAKLEVDGGFAVTPTTLTAAANVTVPDNETVLRILNDGANVAIAVAAPATAAEGQFLSIRNEDATNIATFAGTAIPAGQMGEFIFLNGGWRFRAGTASTAWGLTGNAGTVAGTNYIGTTDAQAFDVRTAGTIRARFTTTGGIQMANPSAVGNTVVGATPTAAAGLTGTNNSIFGFNAGASMTTGIQNTAMGQQALAFNVAGQGNTAIGRVALGNGAGGSANTGIGAFSLLNTATNFNTALGYASGQTITTGGDNVAIGDFTLDGTTTGIGNTAVGSVAGTGNTTGSLNTFIGASAIPNAAALTNATAIGALSRVDASNALVLGSVNGVNGATATSNVGIGLNAPTTRLHINGAYANTFTALAAGAAPAIANNVTHVRLTDDGAVAANAIAGPAAPVDGQVLTIVNNDAEAATFAGATIAASTGAASFVYANGAWRVYGNSMGDNLGNHIATTQIQSTLGTAAAPGYSFIGDLNTGVFSPGADQVAFSTGGTERARITAAGNFGVGAVAPTFRMEVAGNGTGGILIPDNAHPGFPNGYRFLQIGDDAYFSDVDVANTTALYGNTNPDRAGLYFGSSGAMVYGINNNIGVGTMTPQQAFHVVGTTRVSTLAAPAGTVRLTQTDVNGDLAMGPRYMHGRINADGTIAGGSAGYTITKLGVGQYRIDYTTAYTTVPTVTAVGVRVAGGACLNSPPATCGVSWDTWGCTDGDFINSFTTTGGTTNITNNGTGCNGGVGGYGNFTGLIVTAAAGANFTVNATPGTWGQGYRVWADFNQNGTFDAGESIGSTPGSSTAMQSFTCTVPGGTTCGTYRLRIRSEFADVPSVNEGCGNPEGEFYGEAEDYTLVVSGGGGSVTPDVSLNAAGTGNSEIFIFDQAGVATDAPFHFQVIGQ